MILTCLELHSNRVAEPVIQAGLEKAELKNLARKSQMFNFKANANWLSVWLCVDVSFYSS
jgi:hypothetical protein